MAHIPEALADTWRDRHRRQDIKDHGHCASMQVCAQVAQFLCHLEVEDGARVVRMPLGRRVRDGFQLDYLG